MLVKLGQARQAGFARAGDFRVYEKKLRLSATPAQRPGPYFGVQKHRRGGASITDTDVARVDESVDVEGERAFR
jgi:hypothetical protein